MKKIVAGTSALALVLSMASITAVPTSVFAANQQGEINLQVEVLDTLSMDCFDADGISGDTTVTLDDSTTGEGMVVAGVPSVGKSRCEVTTNDDQGYYLTIERSTEDVTWGDGNGTVEAGENGDGQNSGATSVLIHEDVNLDGTWYEIADTLTAFDPTATGNAAAWVDGTTKGFGFSVVAFPDTTTGNNALADSWVTGANTCQDGTAGGDTALYAGVPAAATAISAVPEYAAGTTTTDVCYKVDVDATQQSGEYAGQVTFTATSDASDYIL